MNAGAIFDRLFLRLRHTASFQLESGRASDELRGFDGARYCLLVSFKRSGEAVPTPVWFGVRDDRLFLRTALRTGKLKRIRNNPRVTVAACDFRGNPTGEPIEARARIGDRADWQRVTDGLRRKYGVTGRLTLLGSRLRRGAEGTVAVLVDRP